MSSEGPSDQLTLWPGVSPVSLIQSPEPVEGSKTNDTSGRSSSGLSASYDLLGLSLRTCLVSVLPQPMKLSATWRRAATPSGRLWWVLAISGLPTSDDECSSSLEWPTAPAQPYGTSNNGWPTARAEDSECAGAHVERGTAETLTAAARMWLTATAGDGKSSGSRAGTPRASEEATAHPGTSLTDAVTGQWATPSSQDAKNDTFPKSQEERKGGTLPSQFMQLGLHRPAIPSGNGKSPAWPTAHGMDNEGNPRRNGPTGNELGRAVTKETYPTPTSGSENSQHTMQEWGGSKNALRGTKEARGTLNPRWVLQLMGFPKAWLDSVPPIAVRRSRRSATRSSRK